MCGRSTQYYDTIHYSPIVDYVLLTGNCIWLENEIVWETHAADELLVRRCAAAPSPPPNVHTRRVQDREKRLLI